MGSAKRKRVRGRRADSTDNKRNPVPSDPRYMEKTTWTMNRIMSKSNFENREEATDMINKILKNRENEKFVPDNDYDRAQELAYEAYGKTVKDRYKLAMEALSISDDCTDAYIILAELEKNLEKKKELYEKGVEAGRRHLGNEMFETEKGYFWGLIDTRPYMRAMAGLSDVLWALNLKKEATEVLEQLIELNPDDNQGNRYVLIALYLDLKELDKAKALIKKYDDESSATWDYSRALLLFLTGPTAEANKTLINAFESNKYIPMMLLGLLRIPQLSNYITPGNQDEAASYVVPNYNIWHRDDNIMAWLRKMYIDYGSKSHVL